MEPFISVLIAIVTVCCLLFYWYCVSTFDYWSRKGVKYLKPTPLFGNVKNIILRRRSPARAFQELYNEFKGERYGGVYQARTPVLLVRDPELIKLILVKDFSCFPSKGIHADLQNDPLSCHLFNLEGDQWRYIRTKLTPAFTSSKLKIVYQHIDHFSEQLIEHLEKEMKKTEIIDIYSELVNFTMDATGSCAFGIEVNAMTDVDSVISKMGHRVIEANGNTLFEMLNSISPRLPKLLNMSIFSEDVARFFKDIIQQIIHYRDENHINKKDVMQLLMLARHKTCEGEDHNSDDSDHSSHGRVTEKDEGKKHESI